MISDIRHKDLGANVDVCRSGCSGVEAKRLVKDFIACAGSRMI